MGAAAAVQGSNFSRRYYRVGLTASAVVENGTTGSGMGNTTTGTGNGTVAGSGTAGNCTNNGVSPLDISAAVNGGVTVAKTPTANNSLGLNIESVEPPSLNRGKLNADLPPIHARANDVGYLAIIQIGTPPRDFQLLMDSGSADFCESLTIVILEPWLKPVHRGCWRKLSIQARRLCKLTSARRCLGISDIISGQPHHPWCTRFQLIRAEHPTIPSHIWLRGSQGFTLPG